MCLTVFTVKYLEKCYDLNTQALKCPIDEGSTFLDISRLLSVQENSPSKIHITPFSIAHKSHNSLLSRS